jgi:hypothetical protein
MHVFLILGRFIVGVAKNILVNMLRRAAAAQAAAITTRAAAQAGIATGQAMRQMAKATIRLSQLRFDVKIDAKFKWHPGFQDKLNKRLSLAQKYLDNQVLMDCEPYMPLLTGTLIRSGIMGTHIGSGKLQWITPYARRQYYLGRLPGMSQAGPLRGRYWFERAKVANKHKWIAGVEKIMKG